jgi:hypothetical protein
MSLRGGISSIQERILNAPPQLSPIPLLDSFNFSLCLQNTEGAIKLLADARKDQDAMEINISDLHNYYKRLSKNTSELFWEIT